MKNFGICALLAAGVSAIPMAAPKHAHQHQHKRDVVWVTETDVDVVTVPVTKTVWVDGATAQQANQRPTGYHYTKTAGSSATSAAASDSASSVASSSASAYSAPAAPESTSSTSVYVAPTTSSTSVYVAPTTSSTSVYVAPTTSSTSEYSAPAPTTPTSTYVAPSTTSTSAAATSTTASSGSGGSYSGDLTYYDVGLGSCGTTNTDDEMVVALAAGMMDKATDCGRSISISYGGVTADATIVDTCPGCAGGSLDLSPALFVKFAPTASGRLSEATWSFN